MGYYGFAMTVTKPKYRNQWFTNYRDKGNLWRRDWLPMLPGDLDYMYSGIDEAISYEAFRVGIRNIISDHTGSAYAYLTLCYEEGNKVHSVELTAQELERLKNLI